MKLKKLQDKNIYDAVKEKSVLITISILVDENYNEHPFVIL